MPDGALTARRRSPCRARQSVNLAGLFPSTQYEITVTAYINGQGTASHPIASRPAPKGPPPPATSRRPPTPTATGRSPGLRAGRPARRLRAGVDAGGSSRSSATAAGLSAAPAPISRHRRPDVGVAAAAQLSGGDALLGRGLRFNVEGIGDDGRSAPVARHRLHLQLVAAVAADMVLTPVRRAATPLRHRPRPRRPPSTWAPTRCARPVASAAQFTYTLTERQLRRARDRSDEQHLGHLPRHRGRAAVQRPGDGSPARSPGRAAQRAVRRRPARHRAVADGRDARPGFHQPGSGGHRDRSEVQRYLQRRRAGRDLRPRQQRADVRQLRARTRPYRLRPRQRR